MSRQIILAAGSMLRLLPKLLDAHFSPNRPEFDCQFGPSGSLRAKIETGHSCQLFISATDTHTQALVDNSILDSSNILGLNPTVLLHRASLDIPERSALEWVLNEELMLGMSTTGLDPAEDELIVLNQIANATDTDPKRLKSRTRIITGGRETPNAPPGRNQYGWIMETQNVDLMLTFQSNAIEAIEDNPHLRMCHLPKNARVTGHYGIAISHSASAELVSFYNWLRSEEGSAYLTMYGFELATSTH